jgi:ssDNA thymidine ADP-ribosyltransferase, DarT
MQRSRVDELHFICPFTNVASVLQRGILSKTLQHKLVPDAASVADADVQDRRAAVRVPPNGRALHSYANLYFHARNAMLSARRHLNDSLAVVRVSTAVLDLPDVIVTDRNAAADAVIFRNAAEGIAALDADAVYATWWNQSTDAKQRRCAEVLVPERVPPEYVLGAYVRTDPCKATLNDLCPPGFAIAVDLDLYFNY